MRIERKASLLFLISLALYLALSFALSLLPLGDNTDLLYLANALLVSIPAFLVPALLFRRRNSLKLFKAPKFGHIMLAVALGYGCLLMNNALSYLNMALFSGVELQSNSTTAETIMGLNFFNMIFSLAIVPPVAEEFIMRGTMLESWRRTSPIWAMVLTSTLFAFLHLAPSNFIVYFGMGMLFAGVYMITRNVWLTVTMHFVNNMASVVGSLVLKYMYSGQEDVISEAAESLLGGAASTLGMFMLYSVMTTMTLVPLFLALVATYKRAKLGMFAEEPDTEESEAKPSLFRDPILWVVMGILIVLNLISGLMEFGVIKL